MIIPRVLCLLGEYPKAGAAGVGFRLSIPVFIKMYSNINCTIKHCIQQLVIKNENEKIHVIVYRESTVIVY